MNNTILDGFNFIGTTVGVCNGEPIIIGTRLKPDQVVSYGNSYDACVEFDLDIEQVLECYRFVGKTPTINVYLDDLRDCPKGFVLAKNIIELKALFSKYPISIISLDHDLGVDENDELFETGYDFIKHFCEHGLYCEKIYIHTDNTVGRANMYETLLASRKRGFISQDIQIFNTYLFPNKYTDKQNN